MRFRATKERRKEREEFVYKYYNEILDLLTDKDIKSVEWKERVKSFVETKATVELRYSCKTNWIDIFTFVKRTFKTVFNFN